MSDEKRFGDDCLVKGCENSANKIIEDNGLMVSICEKCKDKVIEE